MEGFIQFVTQNWSRILEYAMVAVCYFLVFLYRAKVGSARRDLKALFRSKSDEVTETDRLLREDVGKMQTQMKKELAEAKSKYRAAVDEICDLKARLIRAEDTLRLMINDEMEAEDDGVYTCDET